jgi:hypothetical protein
MNKKPFRALIVYSHLYGHCSVLDFSPIAEVQRVPSLQLNCLIIYRLNPPFCPISNIEYSRPGRGVYGYNAAVPCQEDLRRYRR